jgi:CubicO group peptidase (beta-lactamase class C family)
LCQLSAASVVLASSGPAGAIHTASLEPGAGRGAVLYDRTESGGAVTIRDREDGVSVTLDGAPREAEDGAGEVLFFDNSNLPRSGAPASAATAPGEVATGPVRFSIEGLLERAMARNLIDGGVAVVGNRQGILSSISRGHLNNAPGAPALSDRTIFDLASLTKVIATAPAVMKLLDQGRLNLADPISKWIPEFANPGHDELTVLSLLTHTSGLDDFGVGADQPMQSAIAKAAAQKHRAHPNSRFHYADINFILLGELVHRISGEPLNTFCQQEIYAPLGAGETMFLPPRSLNSLIAPTAGPSACGIVQDPNARRLGGVAGHAGLFSSAYDLSRYARMMLGGGMLDGRRILSEQVVAQMTSPFLANSGTVSRGLGWDINSPFSAPKGSYFSDASFGHTGYSGSSIWIDPQQDLFVILLTNRNNYRDTHAFNQLRRDVSTLAAATYSASGQSPALAAARFNAVLLQEVTRAMQASPRIVKVASLKRGKLSQLQRGRRACKSGKVLVRGRRGVRSAESHRVTRSAKSQAGKAAGKAAANAKKKKGGRRA